LAAKNALYVSEASFEAADFLFETELAGYAEGFVKSFLGVTVAAGRAGGRVGFVHGVVGLFGVALAGG